MKRDVIVIGGSAGGLDVLLNLISHLPADLSASVFVVLHRRPEHPALLPELLSSRGKLPARHALHGERVEPGTIYIAPPDNHLLLRPGSVEVVRGPKENGHRPAVDALFRTAAAAYGPRVVGVVLSGYQDCGTAGILSIKARGGVSIVQAPESAVVREMPQSILDRAPVDHVVAPSELPGLVVRLSAEPAGSHLSPSAAIQELEGSIRAHPSELVCPLCEGSLGESQVGAFHHYRCHVGHAFSLQSLIREQNESVERALWAAVRALDDSASLTQRVAAKETGELRQRLEEKGRTLRDQAKIIREILLDGARLSAGDGSGSRGPVSVSRAR